MSCGPDCPCRESRPDPRDEQIATLTRDLADARDGIGIADALWQQERATLMRDLAKVRRDLAAVTQEADRLRHGLAIEGDHVCPNVLLADEAERRLAAIKVAATDLVARLLRAWSVEGNIPGHCHSRRGIWDDDNGERAGKPCEDCAAWQRLRSLLTNDATPAPSKGEG